MFQVINNYEFRIIKRGGVMKLGLEVGGKFKGELGLKKESIQ